MAVNNLDDDQFLHDDYKARDTGVGYSWIKVRTNLLDDQKYFRLSDFAKVLYFELYLLAGKSDAGGLILGGDEPAIDSDLAYILHRSIDELMKGLKDLQVSGLVTIDNGQVIINRFTNEQGPSMADRRKEWAKRQAKRRAIARGETWIETETDENSETVKDLKTKKETDKDIDKDKTRQEVTHTSRDSHEIVTRDIETDKKVSVFEGLFNDVLVLWHDVKGRDYRPTPAYNELINDWVSAGVELPQVRKALEQAKDTAVTPMYLRDIAIKAKDNDPKVKEQARLEHFRELYRQQKQNGATNE